MGQSTPYELRKLGSDAERHEDIKKRIDESFEETIRAGYPIGMIAETRELLRELIDLRKLHGLPNNGECNQCLGDKCPTA